MRVNVKCVNCRMVNDERNILMSEAKFKHYDLELVLPSFDSALTDLIIELDYLRRKELSGSTHPQVFFQLKHIFHTLESIGSARIEGNNTTIAEYIETKIDKEFQVNAGILEIQNIEKAMEFIELNVIDYPINRAFISELHKAVVSGLAAPPHGEGDLLPGEYRKVNPIITNSEHIPPDYISVSDYMDELIEFINHPDSSKYDLLKVAVAHHRFVWIHPFINGNGRTVRLLTYAMLVKMGFNVNVGRILNPTAVFCSNRADYYNYLSLADSGSSDGILSWTEYVLKGLKEEIEKIDKLTDYSYLQNKILTPALDYSLDRGLINDLEYKVLNLVVKKQVIQAGDIKSIFKDKLSSELSRQIKKLIDKNMLTAEKEGSRKYILRFDNSYLIRGIIHALGDNGFLPDKSNK